MSRHLRIDRRGLLVNAGKAALGAVAAGSVLRNGDTFGVLELTLHPTSYDWRFVPEEGKTFTDSGSSSCH